MRKFYNGNADLIAKVAGEAVMVAFMNGDGCQAPGAAVIRKVRDTAKGASFDEYAVHFANTQCGGYHGGSYSRDLAGALEAFDDRCKRYDPDGTRRASYLEGTGTDRVNLYYANEEGRGMTAIIGVAGKEAHTVEANGYRATEAELAELVNEIDSEFNVSQIIRFDTIAELEAAYKG